MQKKRVYLDLCVWIALRNAELGTNPHGDASALLQKLREAIGAGRVLCPISEIVFLELMKQADVRTRRATTRLIDELSTGVALTPRIDRVTIELRQLLLKQHEPTVSPSALVWSKVTQVLGPFVPDSPHLDPQTQERIAKQFFDHLWTMPLESLEKNAPSREATDRTAFIATLNAQIAENSESFTSFPDVYRAEASGCASDAAPIVADLIEELARQQNRTLLVVSPKGRVGCERNAFNLLCALAHESKLASTLPTIHLEALLYAAHRWDKQRKLKVNDTYDFSHAVAAIPYCDLFVTEKPLTTLLAQRHLHVQRDFSCQVTASLLDAVRWLHRQTEQS